jgi:hypothetical protein
VISEPNPPVRGLDAGRLWSGGFATAVVAALIARGVFDIAVLAPKGEGLWGNANTTWGNANTTTYALSAAGCALVATALLQLLAAKTPGFGRFFTWIMMLITVAAAAIPLSLDVKQASMVATAVINFVIGIAILTMLNGVARAARTTSRQSN